MSVDFPDPAFPLIQKMPSSSSSQLLNLCRSSKIHSKVFWYVRGIASFLMRMSGNLRLLTIDRRFRVSVSASLVEVARLLLSRFALSLDNINCWCIIDELLASWRRSVSMISTFDFSTVLKLCSAWVSMLFKTSSWKLTCFRLCHLLVSQGPTVLLFRMYTPQHLEERGRQLSIEAVQHLLVRSDIFALSHSSHSAMSPL